MPRYKHTLTFESDNPTPPFRSYAYDAGTVIEGVPYSSILTSTEEVTPEPLSVTLAWPPVTLTQAQMDFILVQATAGHTYFTTGCYFTGGQARAFAQALIDFANQVDPAKTRED